jgi:enediyne polyketide synthase
MTPGIAIVGMACRFPEARSPAELWENVLAQRRAFRRLPACRLRAEDYLSPDRSAPDRTYAAEAALIDGYEFDRLGFRVAGETFRSADLAHWLALDVAAQALADAGLPEGEGLPRETTGVLLGNTLTGEFSRASVLRLRWPYVRRVVEAALGQEGWSPGRRRAFVERLEAQYKAPFPPVGEETLAGGLSNTIAGRICNHFDLQGGGYTVDGACAASLLAVTTACTALAAGDLDVALAGGVDLSLDPFELVGFAKAGALAADQMRVYDLRSAGFWPGEGCGFVVLMRHADAVAQGRRIYAVVRGWGVSSDGSGGITRPEVEGQLLALRRAYRRAGVGADGVAYFEGHGTGTAVGDATELQVLARARREADGAAPPAAIGSIKANIGHAKAAAGIAGLIKAAMAIQSQVLPPTTGCEQPHPELTAGAPALRVLADGEPWPADRPLRAGVSAMGFGGINTHVVIEGVAGERRTALAPGERLLISSAQDAELFLLAAEDSDALRRQAEHLSTFAADLSRSELADLAAELARRLAAGEARAALVASGPAELASRLETLRSWLTSGVTRRLDLQAGLFLGTGRGAPRIGFLFPGQGSPAHLGGGAWRRRFDFVRGLYGRAGLPTAGDGVGTAVAQPAIVIASLAALRALEAIGLTACLAVGHSLGELTALHWAGALDEEALLRIASARGKAMAELGSPTGAMASIGAGRQEVEGLLNGQPIVVAGLNAPGQTVVSGEAAAVGAVVSIARARGLRATRLPVSHAFHSPLVAAAAPALAAHISREVFRPLRRTVLSTVTGAPLAPDEDLPALLCRQVTSPVRFLDALAAAAERVDLFIEVGPGAVLSGLVAESVETPAVALDAGGPSLRGLLSAVGAAFAAGAPIDHAALFAGRFTRPFTLDWRPRFFANPCELAPVPDVAAPPAAGEPPDPDDARPVAEGPGFPPCASPLDLVRQLVAERAELPPAAVKGDHRLLSDLHLNSIAVSQIVIAAARRLGLPSPVAPTEYAGATVGEVARALEELARAGVAPQGGEDQRAPAGVDAWVRTFTVQLVERPLRPRPPPADGAGWQVIAPPDHPLSELLRLALARPGGGGGVIVCLPPEPDERHVGLLLQGARAILAAAGRGQAARFVLVQHGGGAAAFARTLHLETPEITTCVVDVPLDHPAATDWVIAEARAAAGYAEAHYDASGLRREPVLRLLPLAEEAGDALLGPGDVLLVTGGGKGIAAECALSLARQSGARLALLGRSRPEADPELAANLERMAGAGVAARYLPADVTDPVAVRAAVGEVQSSLGGITAVLHGAGTNAPQLLASLGEAAALRTLRPKVQGARNVLAAVDPGRLRLLVTFGSIIARTGMRGEADYALANEWLARLTERWAAEHPHCRCVAVEWSVWSGVGMGERLGRVDALVRQGITPIPPDEGVAILRRLVAGPLPAASVVVAGRIGDAPTLRTEQPALPFLRFLERPRVYCPGVELVVEAELSGDADPYLDDHVYGEERLFPAVMGLEAMAQAAIALSGAPGPPRFEDVQFARPVILPGGANLTIRTAALVREPGRVEVALRSSQTAFQVDHFRATCRFGGRGPGAGGRGIGIDTGTEATGVPIDPERDLYGRILFHRGRFRRLRAYRWLRAKECVAEIGPDGAADWFARYLPATLVLGDPAVRDAAIHAIQACIPHATVLPIGVDRLVPGIREAAGPWVVRARERSRDGDTFTYDVEVSGADGSVGERWEGLRLRRAGGPARPDAWAEALLGPYLERRLQELIPGAAVEVLVGRGGGPARRRRSDRAIQRAIGTTAPVRRRPDGKPEVAGGRVVSAAHAGDLVLAVAGQGPLGCDIEPVVARPAAVWRELLGPERFALAGVISLDAREDETAAATRVWAAAECLKKAGALRDAPLVLASCGGDGWVTLAAGGLTIATFVGPVRGAGRPVAVAVLVGNGDARL